MAGRPARPRRSLAPSPGPGYGGDVGPRWAPDRPGWGPDVPGGPPVRSGPAPVAVRHVIAGATGAAVAPVAPGGGRGRGGRAAPAVLAIRRFRPEGGPSGERGAARRRKEVGRKRSIIWRLRRPIFLIGLAMLAMIAGVGVVVARTELPEFDHLEQASYICAGEVRARASARPKRPWRGCSPSDGNRTNITLEEVPPIVVQAVLAVEDRDFYEHDGVNPEGIMRAMFQNVRSRSVQQGGSTITQQYVLNSFSLSRDGGISRKLKEAVLSIKLEQDMSKDEILEGYLNTVFFGRGAYGVAAASRAYFGLDVAVRSPTPARPPCWPGSSGRRPPPSRARTPKRRPAGATPASSPWRTRATSPPSSVEAADAVPVAEPWVVPLSTVKLVDTLKGADRPTTTWAPTTCPRTSSRELQRIDPDRFTEEMIRGGGLRIYTSINYDLQRAAWQAVTTNLPNEDDPNTPEWEGDPEASMVAVDEPGPRARDGGQPPPVHPGHVRGELRGPRATAPRGASRGRRSSRSCWPRPCGRATRSTPATTPRERWSSRSGRPTASPGRSATTPRATPASWTSCGPRPSRRTPPSPSSCSTSAPTSSTPTATARPTAPGARPAWRRWPSASG